MYIVEQKEYIMNNAPYTYLIGWTDHNKWYYGVRYAKNCNPADLWVTYFTSSKHVKEFRKLNGEPNVIIVRKTFIDKEKAKLWEHEVLKRMNVVDDNKWLNKNDRLAPPIMYGHTHNIGRKPSEISLEKRKQSMTKTMAEKFPIENRYNPPKFSSEKYRNNMAESVSKSWETRDKKEIGKKISKSLRGKPKTGKAARGHIKSEEWRRKSSESIKAILSTDPDKTTKGKLWWNNGLINTRSKVSPGVEWIKGKLPHNKSYNSEKMKEIWAKRKSGELTMPNYKK